ncbi:MAG: DUF6249 domain-containing protein [Pseudomonadota bacterium]
MEDLSTVLIVGSVMGALFGIVFSFFYFRARSQQQLHQTLRAAIDKGESLTPDLVEQLGRPKNADLRRGVVGLALGTATALFGIIIGEPDAIRPMLGIGLFPTVIGLAYVTFWVVQRDRPSQGPVNLNA